MSFDYSQPHTIINGIPVALTTEQIAEIATAQTAAISQQNITNLVNGAKLALASTDTTYIRCAKAGVVWPPEWQTYVVALRAIVNNPSSVTTLPTPPSYPSGT